MIRHERYNKDGNLIRAIEIEKVDGEVVVRRFDADGLVEERPATEREIEELQERLRAEKKGAANQRLATQVATARQWAEQMRSTTVTQGNAVAVLDTLLNRTAAMLDVLADLVVALDKGEEID